MKSKRKRIQEIQEKKRKENIQVLIFYQKPSFTTKSFNSPQHWSLYRVFPRVKYHHALKKALNKEGKSGKGENKVKKVNKRERDNSHKLTFSHCAKFRTLVRNFAPWCEFSHPGANFRTLVRIFAPWCEFSHPGAKFLALSSSIPLMLLFYSSAPDF